MKRILKNHTYFYKIFLSHQPIYFIATLLQNVLRSLSFILLLQYSILIVVDGINNMNILPVMFQILLIFAFSVILSFTQSLFDYKLDGIAREKMEYILFKDVFNVIKNIDIKHFENPELFNALTFAKDITGKAFESLRCLSSLLGCIAGILGLSSMFLALSPISLIIVIITFILDFILRIFVNKSEFKYEADSVSYNRQKSYLERIFFSSKFMNEIKLNNLDTFLINKYDIANKALLKQKRKNAKSLFFLNGFVDFTVNFLISSVVYNLVLVYQVVVTGTLSIGAYAALYFASISLLGRLREISSSIQNFGRLSLYIEKIRDVLSIKSELKAGNNELTSNKCEMLMQNITFYYDEAKYVLKNLNLHIQFGKRVAIVGVNGGGKSTLVKLILRLYDPVEGYIAVDGKDIRQFDLQKYRLQFSTLFQDLNIYAIPLINNVIMDQVISKENVAPQLLKAMEHLKIKEDRGLNFDTVLSQEYDENGTELSKGEQQKIGVARIIYSNKDIIILDEPSAALDPVAEYEFNRKIQSVAKGKTLIMISHRLSTTRNADHIFVLHDGRVIEEGNHESLMANHSYYEKMYTMQASKFFDYESETIKKY